MRAGRALTFSVYWIHLWPVAKQLQELEVTFREHTIQRKKGTISSLCLVLEERKEPLSRLLLIITSTRIRSHARAHV